MSLLPQTWARNGACVSSIKFTINHELVGELRVPVLADILQAAERIRGHIRRTPLLRSAALDEIAGGPVWLKAESLQVTSSFKIRGAFNALLAMPHELHREGVIAYSTGNHGQAIAWAAKTLGIPATIVMPADAPTNKVKKALDQGARVVHYDRERESRELIGLRLREESGGTLIPPGDHPDVIAGQGTLMLEVLEDLPPEARQELGSVLGPCGGGGMLAGCGLTLKGLSPESKLVAVEPVGFDDTVQSLITKKRVANSGDKKTLCDALMAATPAELPYEINSCLLDQALSVTDSEVEKAVRFALDDLRLVVEPGGAVALAAVLASHVNLRGKHSVVVLSGGNIDLHLLRQVLQNGHTRD